MEKDINDSRIKRAKERSFLNEMDKGTTKEFYKRGKK